jgi:hypothetical protein
MDTFVNDTIQLNINTNIDISGYATIFIKYRRPDGTVGCWIAALCIGDNSCMTYTTINGDLDQSGEWLIQAVAEDVGVALHGRWTSFDVHEPLTATCPPLTTLAPTTAAP